MFSFSKSVSSVVGWSVFPFKILPFCALIAYGAGQW